MEKLNKSIEQISSVGSDSELLKLKKKVAPVGIVDYDNTISPNTESTAKEYFTNHSVKHDYNYDAFLTDIKSAVGEARALYCLKQKNQKLPLKKNIELVVKHTEMLSRALMAVENDYYTLGLLRQEIDREKEVIGYQVYKKLIDPGGYAQEELEILLPILKRVQETIKKASELKTTDWQLLLCSGMIKAEEKLNGSIPAKTSTSGTSTLPAVYGFISSISINEFGCGTSEEKVKQALRT